MSFLEISILIEAFLDPRVEISKLNSDQPDQATQLYKNEIHTRIGESEENRLKLSDITKNLKQDEKINHQGVFQKKWTNPEESALPTPLNLGNGKF
jgi:hypothetical protein